MDYQRVMVKSCRIIGKSGAKVKNIITCTIDFRHPRTRKFLSTHYG
jgi:hypothetical protein